MILDSLKNSGLYETIHPLFKIAFDFLRSHDLASLPAGKVNLQGDDLVVNVVDAKGRELADAKVETHVQFIDIQVPVGGVETMGWTAAHDLTEVSAEYDEVKDLTFYNDPASQLFQLRPLEFCIFFPSDGHLPQIFSGTQRKIIVKVRV